MEQQNQFYSPWVIVVITLAVIAFILGVLLYETDAELNRASFDKDDLERRIQAAEDSISKLNALNTVYDNRIVEFRDSLVALSKVKNKVIIKYRDQKNFVNDADIHQLDSIIRANVGTGQ